MSLQFCINNRVIGKDFEPYIIAECGINHNGSIEIAKQMIETALEVGADAVKFQTFKAEEFIQDKSLTYSYRSNGEMVTESMQEMFKRYEFSSDEWKIIKSYCEELNIAFLSTPQNKSDLELLLGLNIEAIKVGSDDFVNIPLIREYKKSNLPLILSCGMANKEEISNTLNEAGVNDDYPIVLMICTSEYPTPDEDVNILRLKTLSDKYPNIILGFSDHTIGVESACLAVSMGARVFEKHFTLNNDMFGPDHWFSENPQNLKKWIDSIRKSYKILGTGLLEPSEKEKEMRILAHRSITAKKDIGKEDVFTEDNICMKRPGNGLLGYEWDNVIGKKTTRNILSGEQIKKEDVCG